MKKKAYNLDKNKEEKSSDTGGGQDETSGTQKDTPHGQNDTTPGQNEQTNTKELPKN